MQLFSVLPNAPPPQLVAEFPAQRAVVERAAISPAAITANIAEIVEIAPLAELPVSVQLLSVPPAAPPPHPAELPVSVQLLSVPL